MCLLSSKYSSAVSLVTISSTSLKNFNITKIMGLNHELVNLCKILSDKFMKLHVFFWYIRRIQTHAMKTI
jgi:hypothetical protein